MILLVENGWREGIRECTEYGGEKKAARECLKECGQWKKEAKEAYQVSAIVVVVFIR